MLQAVASPEKCWPNSTLKLFTEVVQVSLHENSNLVDF